MMQKIFVETLLPAYKNISHAVSEYIRWSYRTTIDGWNQFWFTPRSPYWLGVLRVLAGIMVLYTHLVWTLDFEGFLGVDRRIASEIAAEMNPSMWYWSHFDWFTSPTILWSLHWVAILVFTCFTLGLTMPWTGWLATLFAISYAHRASGALFGLDQMNVALTLYLTLGGAGRLFSLDRWFELRRQDGDKKKTIQPPPTHAPLLHSVMANIATRLIQVQLCIIYLFAGTGKLQGVSWWNGEALWGALASYQYQSIDMTWTHQYPTFLALATHLSVAWEVSYLFLVWPKLTRPLVITMAVMVHLGIGMFLGMMTFGYVMIVANLAFIEWDGLFHRQDAVSNLD